MYFWGEDQTQGTICTLQYYPFSSFFTTCGKRKTDVVLIYVILIRLLFVVSVIKVPNKHIENPDGDTIHFSLAFSNIFVFL